MEYSANYYSTRITVSSTPTDYTVGVDIPTRRVTGIQNNSTESVSMHFNGGDGVLRIPVDGYFEPFTPLTGTFTLYGDGAGDCCVLG